MVTTGLNQTREPAAVQWWEREGDLLSLVDIKSTNGNLPFDTLVTGMVQLGGRRQRSCICVFMFTNQQVEEALIRASEGSNSWQRAL